MKNEIARQEESRKLIVYIGKAAGKVITGSEFQSYGRNNSLVEISHSVTTPHLDEKSGLNIARREC